MLPLSRSLSKEEMNWAMVHDQYSTTEMFKGTVLQEFRHATSLADSSNIRDMLEFLGILSTLQ